MAANKTVPTGADVDAFIDGVDHERRRQEARTVLAMMREITGEEPVMWGPSIIGFGSLHYRYDSGREGDMPAAAFSPRKAQLTVYIDEFDEREELLGRLGPHSTGKSCLYIKRLDAVDIDVLRQLVAASYRHGVASHDPSTSRA
jgi:hypothetical protein